MLAAFRARSGRADNYHDLERYTERSRGFLQAAQALALRSGHQRLAPEHLLKVLLDDREGLAANLIRAAGGDPVKALSLTEADLARMPRSRVRRGTGLYGPRAGPGFRTAQSSPRKPANSYVTAERLLLALALLGGSASRHGAGRGRASPPRG